MQKLYCYVDETGQDTLGKFFLVAVAVAEGKQKDSIGLRLELAEKESGKRFAKWGSTKLKHKKDYLKRVANIHELGGAIFYAIFENTKEYLDLTASTVGEAILLKKKGKFQVVVIADGLNEAERWVVSRKLKGLGITRKKVKGARFRSDPFIRLVDAFAGFLRDHEEGQVYAKELFKQITRTISVKKINKKARLSGPGSPP